MKGMRAAFHFLLTFAHWTKDLRSSCEHTISSSSVMLNMTVDEVLEVVEKVDEKVSGMKWKRRVDTEKEKRRRYSLIVDGV